MSTRAPTVCDDRRNDRRRGPILAAAAGWLLALGLALSAPPGLAQHAGDMGSAPPPPRGDGRLTVQVLHETETDALAGLAIALYALAPDGTPGFMGGETDATGRFVFEGISTDPGIVYLLGARYAEIPFGERVTFAEGEKEARVEIRISSPTDVVSGVEVEELRARIDWMGDRVVVTEILRLSNPGERVVQLPANDPERSIIVRPLGPIARDFSLGPGSIGDGLALTDGEVRFWGPLYPGEQRVEYRYSLPLPPGERTLRLPIQLRESAARVVAIAGTTGLTIDGPGLVESREVESDAGTALASWARSGLAAGERFEIELTLPESRLDASLLSVPRSDVWLEVDDTRLTARVDIQLEVAEGAPVAGTPDAPLFHVSIPEGAEMNGVAPEAESLGLVPTDDGGFDVIGPIAQGPTSLGFSYQMPARPDGIDLDMRFPREVSTLNVLIADTGLAVDSSRLHRRRPFRSGTRNFLHREAYNVSPDELVDLSLTPLRATGMPASASIAITIAAAGAGALFLIAPLRRARQEWVAAPSEAARIHAEREGIYSAIRDLDHDFETGKLEQADHAQMREGLRHQAIELLRAERAAEQAAAGAASAAATTPLDVAPPPSAPTAPPAAVTEAAQAAPRLGAYCPGCGQPIKSAWRFCSHCAEPLEPTESAEETEG